MERIHKQRDIIIRYRGTICSTIQHVIEKNKNDAAAYIPSWNEEYKFEVLGSSGASRVVYLEKRNCTCRKWDLNGIPCPHKIVGCYYPIIYPEDLIDDCYKKSTFFAVYSNLLNPLSDKDIWPEIAAATLLPPDMTRIPGRPKTMRKWEPDENNLPTHGKLKRRNTTNKPQQEKLSTEAYAATSPS